MVHDDFLHDLYDSYPSNFISQNQLESSLDDLAGYDPFSKRNVSKPRYYPTDSFYPPSYPGITTSIHDSESSGPMSHTNEDWSSHSHFVPSPDSSAASPYLSYFDELWSPASATTEPDDDASLASSSSSLSPNSDLDTFPAESVEDEDDDNFFSSLAVSPGEGSLYHPLEQYPLHTSHHERSAYHDDDDLSPLTFSPPSLASLDFLSLSGSGPQSTKKSSTHSPPFQPPQYNFFDYDSSAPVPSSPSRRRSATLPELEPTTFNADLFGLHKSIPEAPLSRDVRMDAPDKHWCSFPGCETDDDLIPVELASKNYIPDPSIIVPSISTGKRSLLLLDRDYDDRNDIPPPRSPSPVDFYLDPIILAECGDEELRKVYELRQRTATSEKWERERCRELSALLRLKLDERGVLGGGEGDCSNHQSGSRSLSCDSNLPFSSSPSSDSLTVYQPQPGIPFSSSSTSSPASSSAQNSVLVPAPSSSPLSTLPSKPQMQSEGPKHKIRSMAQLVASMLFHRQCDSLRRHPSRKAGFEPTSHYAPSSSIGGAAPSTPRSRLSKVILPEELEVDSEGEEGQALRVAVETGDEAVEEENGMNLDGGSSSCLDMDLDEKGSYEYDSSHTVTWAAPSCTRESTE